MKKHKSYINYEDIIDKPTPLINMQQSFNLNVNVKQLKQQQSSPHIPLINPKKPYLQSRTNNRNSLPVIRSAMQSQIMDRDTQFNQKEHEKLKTDYENLKIEYSKQESLVQQLMNENGLLKSLNADLKNQVDDLKINIKRYQQNDEAAYQQYLSNQQELIIKELKSKINQLSEKLILKEKQESQPANYLLYVNEIQSLCLDLKRHLECKYCGKELKDPVTLIPCAHSYCKGCRKGYSNDCFLCGKELKLEAVYLNQFMIDMMALYKRNIGLIEQLKNNL
ncbi:unnamed protein product (macronuclear) [Paramecium tetraurelia]|uniref:RING-type domain-containing protein n=1 Tax=Paramecium tetraurelia TaxID=5888 RepID=A0CG57_PARTE|nr:uncharacterized protein GSPATT00038218001 [Paramecium tetraurelia]CAK69774.1 unnamed protein product [Paramecium tetraurelia]|eukprot:XP_001437171.1 hypothetical protein (macronuclear) [Paramecium tetraurelia strain d4-2]